MKKLFATLSILSVLFFFVPQAHASSTLLTNLVSYWKLDETSGTTTADATGNGSAGTLTTNATFTSAGKINYGITGASSIGTVGGIDLGTVAALDLASFPLSISGWFKTSANGSQGNSSMNIFISTKPSSNYSSFVLYMDMGTATGDRGKLTLNYRNNSGTDYTLATTAAYNDGTWHHVVATIDASGVMLLYVDNTLVASGVTASGSMFTGTKKSEIGRNWDNTSSGVWVGTLDEIGVWSRALTSTEVSQLYNSGAGLQYPFTVASTPSLFARIYGWF